jgi:hypothetical protein
MRHIRGFVQSISVLGVLLFLAAPLSAQPPTGTPVTALTTLAAGQGGRIGFETVTPTPSQSLQGVKDSPAQNIPVLPSRLPSTGMALSSRQTLLVKSRRSISSAMGVRITRGINLAGFFKRHVFELEGQ